MNDEFDRRWKIAAAAVRSTRLDALEPAAPPGFAARVDAARNAALTGPSQAPSWQPLILAFFGATAAVLVLLSGWDLLAGAQNPRFSPGIEDAVGEQLPWFQS